MIFAMLCFYLICPFVELGIIIFLVVKNENYKKRNEELTRLLKEQREGKKAESVGSSAKPDIEKRIAAPAVEERIAKPAVKHPEIPINSSKPAGTTGKQGTLPLVTGVIFIILAGVIFATTTWSRLADTGKVLLVLAGSATFFGASFIAVRKLYIEKTGKAFYILGSMFLFVTVLSVGYFGILGSGYTLMGRYRFFLLFAGILLADGAMFAGLKRFGDLLYTYVCLFGVTLGMACFIGGFHFSQTGFTALMACYGIIVVLLTRRGDGKNNELLPPLLVKVLPSFAVVNLWGISLLVLLNTGFGFVSGAVTLAVAGIHLFLGMKDEKGRGSTYAASALLFISILRMISPEHIDGWLYAGAVTIILLTALEYGGLVSESCRTCLRWTGIASAGILFLAVGAWSMIGMKITLSGVICMGILTLDMAILALEKKNDVCKAAWSGMMAVFIYYLIFYLPVTAAFGLLASAAIFAALFFAGQKKQYALKSMQGDTIYTALILADVCILLIDMWQALEAGGFYHPTGISVGSAVFNYALAASVAILILERVAEYWSRKFSKVRMVLPFVPGLLTLTVGVLLEAVFHKPVAFEVLMFAYVLGLAAWDIVKKDRFLAGVLILGTLTAVGISWSDGVNLPYCLVLAGYLLAKAGQKPSEERIRYEYGSCLYLLAGTYLAFSVLIRGRAIGMLAAALVCLAEFGVCSSIRNAKDGKPFFEVTGSVIYVGMIAACFLDRSVGAWYLVAAVACFSAVYLLCWRGRYHWLNVVSSLATLAIPDLLAGRYAFQTGHLYGTVFAAVFVSGVLCRYWKPIILREENQETRVDWYHVLVVLVLVPMQVLAVQPWRFLYLLLLIAYAAQFIAVLPLRKASYTAVGILGCLAFWSQPFFVWPGIIRTEIWMLPVAVFIFGLAYVWGKTKGTEKVQTVLYLLCLLVLVLDAFHTQNLADALMIEGICLAVFLLSYKAGCRRWESLSIGIMTSVAVYLTRGFWLSLAWWVYLLAAGIGLVAFSAVNEWRKSRK